MRPCPDAQCACVRSSPRPPFPLRRHPPRVQRVRDALVLHEPVLKAPDDALPEPVRPPARAPLRAVLLDAVPRRRQRQHLQERAGHLRRLRGGADDLARRQRARQSRRRRLHRAVHAVLGDRRPARRQVREVAADPLDQAPRDRDHGDRPRRLLAARPRAALHRARADGRALDAVRPGQVRDPAADTCAPRSWSAATGWSRWAPSSRSFSARSSAASSSRSTRTARSSPASSRSRSRSPAIS